MSVSSIALDLAKRFLLPHLSKRVQGVLEKLHGVAVHFGEVIPEGPDRDEALDHLEKAGIAAVRALAAGRGKNVD